MPWSFFQADLPEHFSLRRPILYIQNLANGAYKGPLKINEVMGISPGLFTLLLIIAAVAMFWIAEASEKKFARPDITDEI